MKKKETNRLKGDEPDEEKIKNYIKAAEIVGVTKQDQAFADIVLHVGDRVQIREFIFELAENEKRCGDKQVLICKRRFWQVYHGKVAIDDSEGELRHSILGPNSSFH